MKSSQKNSWINRTTVGISLASLLSDISHELATAVLPAVLVALGAGPFYVGLIEGTSDGISSIAKLWGGLMADRVQKRKPLASLGYLVTAGAVSAIALCTQWWQVLLLRVTAWIGRGSRSAARDVLMIEGAPADALGKAFGMERAGDALGAVIGPVIAAALIYFGYRADRVMLFSIVPGLMAFASITWLVQEKSSHEAATQRKLFDHLSDLPENFRRYLVGIFIFGCGDFSRTLLILYAGSALVPLASRLHGLSVAIALYALHNAVSAVAALPIGAASDRIGKKKLLVAGYVFAALTTVAFGVMKPSLSTLAPLFVCSGLYIAFEEVLEKAFAAQLISPQVKGTAMGVLASTNGVADMISSALVGGLWSMFPQRPQVGFLTAAAFQLLGAILIGRARTSGPERSFA